MLKVLRSTFVDGLIHNDKEVASSKTHAQFKTRIQNSQPIWDQNSQNRYSISDQKGLKKQHPLGSTYFYSPHKGVPPPTVFTHPSNVLSPDPESVQLSSVKVSISFVLELDFLTFAFFSNHLEIHIGVRASVFLCGCLEFHVIFRVWWKYIRNVSEK